MLSSYSLSDLKLSTWGKILNQNLTTWITSKRFSVKMRHPCSPPPTWIPVPSLIYSWKDDLNTSQSFHTRPAWFWSLDSPDSVCPRKTSAWGVFPKNGLAPISSDLAPPTFSFGKPTKVFAWINAMVKSNQMVLGENSPTSIMSLLGELPSSVSILIENWYKEKGMSPSNTAFPNKR